MKRILLEWVLCTGFAGGISGISAQTLEGTYTTELQYGSGRRLNWVNLVRLDASMPLKNGSFDLSTIHIYKVNPERIADDWQVFSNIEEDTRAISIFILGYTQRFRNMSLFGGIRNVNEDYFNSPVTSLFTNSSCGIFPTLSANYPMANYPLSTVCLGYKLSLNSWHIESSVYNGVAHSGLGRKEHIFLDNPLKDGFLSISSINYQTDYGSYFGGVALHNRMYHCNESGEQATETEKETRTRKMNCAWWVYAEQLLCRQGNNRINLLIQYSENPTIRVGCRRYSGLGVVWSGYQGNKEVFDWGICLNYARFEIGNEMALEATYKIRLMDKWVLQPAFHWIKNSVGTYVIGMMRMNITI